MQLVLLGGFSKIYSAKTLGESRIVPLSIGGSLLVWLKLDTSSIFLEAPHALMDELAFGGGFLGTYRKLGFFPTTTSTFLVLSEDKVDPIVSITSSILSILDG